MQSNLYLIEYYTKAGAINFAWVYAEDHQAAIAKLQTAKAHRFEEVIQCGQHAEIVPLSGVSITKGTLCILR